MQKDEMQHHFGLVVKKIISSSVVGLKQLANFGWQHADTRNTSSL